MKKYNYTGSFRGQDIGGKAYILYNGSDYELPEDDEKVITMLRKGELTEVDQQVAPSVDPQIDPQVDPPVDLTPPQGKTSGKKK